MNSFPSIYDISLELSLLREDENQVGPSSYSKKQFPYELKRFLELLPDNDISPDCALQNRAVS